ncbi:class I SAM-dependent methyltransferase [bacterium]|nr:class I SAM-dependent methyltransferase [bacterium]
MPEFVNPKEILSQLRLEEDMVAADFGCGSGSWVIPLAEMLKKGKIFAVDVQKEPLSALEGKAKLARILNIEIIIADVEEKIPEIEDSSCNLVLLTNLLFQIKNKEAVFKQANRVLKKGGAVLVVEWLPNSSFGPKDSRISPDEIKDIAGKAGFSFEKEVKSGDYHYALVFRKK